MAVHSFSTDVCVCVCGFMYLNTTVQTCFSGPLRNSYLFVLLEMECNHLCVCVTGGVEKWILGLVPPPNASRCWCLPLHSPIINLLQILGKTTSCLHKKQGAVTAWSSFHLCYLLPQKQLTNVCVNLSLRVKIRPWGCYLLAKCWCLHSDCFHTMFYSWWSLHSRDGLMNWPTIGISRYSRCWLPSTYQQIRQFTDDSGQCLSVVLRQFYTG